MAEYIVTCDDETALWIGNDVDSMQPIVRCRDCRWAKPDQSDHEYREYYRCNMWIADVGANEFCFRGMRKEGGFATLEVVSSMLEIMKDVVGENRCDGCRFKVESDSCNADIGGRCPS